MLLKIYGCDFIQCDKSPWKSYMNQENNAPFMTKNVSFGFFPWTLLGHTKKH